MGFEHSFTLQTLISAEGMSVFLCLLEIHAWIFSPEIALNLRKQIVIANENLYR